MTSSSGLGSSGLNSSGLGSRTLQEINSQPDCWQRAREIADVPGLPHAGQRVLVLGCGTSYYIAQAYASLREQGGHGR